jgi:hypothetical protein
MSNFIREYYKVPADNGRRVCVDGKEGIIVKSSTHYLYVNFDEDKPSKLHKVHPTWKVTYLDMGKPRPLTRGQERYQRYLTYGENFNSFIDFCKWDTQAQSA